ncbi:lysylphosphatidylglycerol synthase transmembrane domain-containing protein [Enhygromyxa salina]|uniref:Flippase-like domain-containing protein n=1 Tax=Enhygromyxa salina TaxID=215803 RepID=A0A2S9YW09_9BACT|nr:lysylphosphatidylglycerol synthase transmembrane domain-containing protein [Enhygromyxa salina]PRQ09270.1 hypothetical protein ENSA7_09610 [Enhygromyxa salina]
MTKTIDEQLAATERPARRRLEAALRFIVGAALFVVVLRWLAPNWGELAASVDLHLGWALVGVLGTTLASFVTAARWRLLAEVMGGTKLPFVAYFYGLVVTRLIGQFTSTLAMDLVGRGMALRSAGSERSLGHAATQVVLERIFDAALPLVLLTWALCVRDGWLPVSPLVSLALFCLGFLALAIPLLRPAVGVALRLYLWLKLRVARWRRKQIETDSKRELDAAPTVDAALAAKVATYSLLRFAAVVVQFWGIARAVGIQVSWDQMAGATPVAQLAGMLGLTPGGLGVLEAGWVVGLGWVGLASVAISLFVLAQRVGVIASFGLLSAISWPLAKRAALPASIPAAPPTPDD